MIKVNSGYRCDGPTMKGFSSQFRTYITKHPEIAVLHDYLYSNFQHHLADRIFINTIFRDITINKNCVIIHRHRCKEMSMIQRLGLLLVFKMRTIFCKIGMLREFNIRRENVFKED